jgi:hypothetical protein
MPVLVEVLLELSDTEACSSPQILCSHIAFCFIMSFSIQLLAPWPGAFALGH